MSFAIMLSPCRQLKNTLLLHCSSCLLSYTDMSMSMKRHQSTCLSFNASKDKTLIYHEREGAFPLFMTDCVEKLLQFDYHGKHPIIMQKFNILIVSQLFLFFI